MTNRRQANVRDEASQLRRQANDLKDELTAAKWNLEEMESQEENYRAQVVSSPERRCREVEEARNRALREKKENASLESEIQDQKTAKNNLQSAERDLGITTPKLDEIYRSAQKYIALLRALDDNKAQLADRKKQHNELGQKIDEAERRVNRANEKILAQRKQHKLQLEATQEAIDTEKSRILVLEKQRREEMLRIQQGEAEVAALRVAMEEERQKTEDDIREIVAEYKKHEKIFLERDRLRLEALGFSVKV